MSTYSPSLRIELIGTGDQAGTWGNTTNTNLGTLVESAIAGYVSVSVTSANQALTAVNGAADQARNQTIALTTTTTANFAVYAPPAEKTYVIYNASSYTATIYNSTVIGNTTAAGTGVAIPAGKTMTVWTDGTNFRVQNDHFSTVTLGTALAVAQGGTGATTAADARTNLSVPSTTGSGASGTWSIDISGNATTATTATTATGLASTLAVANGGTGATSAANARINLGTVADTAGNGIAARTSANTLTARTITAGTGISVTNGDGVSGNPTIANSGVTSVNGSTGAVTVASPSTDFDGVGSYAILWEAVTNSGLGTPTTRAAGYTAAGSTLRYQSAGNATINNVTNTVTTFPGTNFTAVSGTWRLMQRLTVTTDDGSGGYVWYSGLWVRIS